MPRSIEPRWCERDRAWLVPLGTYDEKNRRRRYVTLRDEAGEKIGREDTGGVQRIFTRMMEAEAEATRQTTGPTVGDVILAYLDWHREKGSRPSTIETHVWHLETFGSFDHAGKTYCDRPAASIGIGDLARVRKAMEAAGAKTGYTKLLYSSVLACWRWATRPVEDREPERLLEVNPFDGLQRPKKGPGRRLVVPWGTLAALIEFANARTNTLYGPSRPLDRLKCLCLRLIIESGCRPHEACGMEWTWVHEDQRVCVIPKDRHKTGEKTGEDRVIVMTAEVAQAMRELRASGGSHPRWVFSTSGDGREAAPTRKKFGYWFNKLKEDAKASGLILPEGTTPYTFRHSLVSQARAGGVQFREMARVMGHDEAVAEKVYAHLETGSARDQFDRMHEARQKATHGHPGGSGP